MKHSFILRKGDTQALSSILQWIAMRDPEIDWQVTVGPYKGSKTAEQLGYYYAAWIPAIQKWLEESKGVFISEDDLDGWLKEEYLGKKTVVLGKQTKVIQPSIARLNVKEMTEYMERVDRHCSERGLILPPPIRRGQDND